VEPNGNLEGEMVRECQPPPFTSGRSLRRKMDIDPWRESVKTQVLET